MNPPRPRGPLRLGIASITLALLLLLPLLALLGSEVTFELRYGRLVVERSGRLLARRAGAISVRVIDAAAPIPPSVDTPELHLEIGRAFRLLRRPLSMSILLAGLLLAAGVGQLRYRPWGRYLTLTWAALALGFVAIIAFHYSTLYAEQMRRVCVLVAGHPARADRYCPTLGLGPQLAVMALGAVFPLVLLIYYRLEGTREAMRS